ncbi:MULTISPECIES: carbohydrate binding family 9 domain-containing protein [unclassified Shewanella]|uniref:carbohydrate binding family 9 domain-containing protein n=1 Tax=unclassified Shewanella TaxID=196818 RepID=UPI000C8160DD|nr:MULTISPECIES: carbohydrate binding family 9 domain-containing protein [unclassified Shewanella]MDO6619488.1 DUF5916 domain-containing protein [Shewanella sp. 6_MG-2023]PMG40032.1 hypothetical protein BCU91_01135 [Shewanella sp. 10N.286.52.B9]
MRSIVKKYLTTPLFLSNSTIRSAAILSVFFSTFLLPASVIAGDASQFNIAIPTLSEAVEIDGELNEPQWQQAATMQLKYETSPGENIAAPVSTEAKIFATETSLFVAFLANDPNPEQIRSNLRDRDSSWGDDQVGIKLDTFNNARLAYQFFINPYGVQNDSIENELTGEESDAWDGIWYASGQITAQGYQVELELPLRLFNFDDNKDLQTWGIELIRFYPRNETHRISSHKIDRNVSCQLCQLGTATGLEGAKQGKDIQITPSVVATSNNQRNLNPNQPWEDDNHVEAGLDLRWGITPTTLLNATINPDFSQVEADSGQLDVNNTFALFYPEKRAFFLDNKDYFDTQLSLLHTRNIASPDYGVKLTSKTDDHTLAVLAANDENTQFLIPGNLSSDIATINEESYNLAARYRFDPNKKLSFGGLVTAKTSENYHNYVASVDIKYQPTEQDTFTGQYVFSDTQYPDDLFQQFCQGEDCSAPPQSCELGNCEYNERVLRTNKQDNFSDSMYRVSYDHIRRNWRAFSRYESIGEDFRADLGFIDRIDASKFVVGGNYVWYPMENFFNKVVFGGDWDITHNQNNEKIEQEAEVYIEFNGGLQSYISTGFVHKDRVGRRHDGSSLAIDGNATMYDINFNWLYANFTPIQSLKLEIDMNYGDDIDYANDRAATVTMFNPAVEWKVTESIILDVNHRYQTLDVDEGTLFTANLTDLRLNWQISLNSFLRLSSVYTDIERDPSLYQYQSPNKQSQNLGNEILYGYKLNPQSVFYLGYSDGLVATDEIDSLTQKDKTYFMKVSYAWLL